MRVVKRATKSSIASVQQEVDKLWDTYQLAKNILSDDILVEVVQLIADDLNEKVSATYTRENRRYDA